MIKKVGIQIAGSGAPVRQELVVTPNMRAIDLLERVNLKDYELCPNIDELPFGEQELIYESVVDSSTMFAYRKAEAGC